MDPFLEAWERFSHSKSKEDAAAVISTAAALPATKVTIEELNPLALRLAGAVRVGSPTLLMTYCKNLESLPPAPDLYDALIRPPTASVMRFPYCISSLHQAFQQHETVILRHESGDQVLKRDGLPFVSYLVYLLTTGGEFSLASTGEPNSFQWLPQVPASK